MWVIRASAVDTLDKDRLKDRNLPHQQPLEAGRQQGASWEELVNPGQAEWWRPRPPRRLLLRLKDPLSHSDQLP